MPSLDPFAQIKAILVIFIISCRTTLFSIDTATCLMRRLPRVVSLERIFALALVGVGLVHENKVAIISTTATVQAARDDG